jgi:cyclopropane fatty-acyl-phospholipid synthase-like methyltransferase
MHSPTLLHYNSHASRFFSRYETADAAFLHALLRQWLPAAGRVLEIGCGSGRDARFMASQLGVDVLSTDGSEKLIALAAQQQVPPDGKQPLFHQAVFPLDVGNDLLNERFDAIVSIAFLMHLADNELFEFAWQVRKMLNSGGIFFCSFCPGRKSTAEDPRFFADRQAGQIQLLFESLGFNLLHHEENADSLGRDLIWTVLVFRLESRIATRPVDQIESIINRDKKTATYKLALLRACCEIAQTS